jgi:hypothetical protein
MKPKYKTGDIVSIKCRVEYDSTSNPERITVSRPVIPTGRANFDIGVEHIDRQLPRPCPAEPPRSAVLSGKDGTIWTYRTDGWAKVGVASYSRTWGQEFYENYGPFNVFTPEGEI